MEHISSEAKEKGMYTVQCHCGAIRARFRCNRDCITVWECNCSDCAMRRNIHFVIPAVDFDWKSPKNDWETNTILYTWGTHVAKRRFCRTCGILPFYTPRSNPNGVAITLPCVIDFEPNAPKIVYQIYDGKHWEENLASSGIAAESSSS
mmetsp:Transcript_7205/g.12929  ORF Transcript_7205/g.12929 Transcript_7205/m.12929 type:complete len:149 (-) Transcript_7205:47-493(-)